MMRRFERLCFLTFVLATLATSFDACLAQTDLVSKKPLDHSDYDKWNTIGSQRISNDGNWISYYLRSGKAESVPKLKIRKNGSAKEYTVDRAGSADLRRLRFSQQ